MIVEHAVVLDFMQARDHRVGSVSDRRSCLSAYLLLGFVRFDLELCQRFPTCTSLGSSPFPNRLDFSFADYRFGYSIGAGGVPVLRLYSELSSLLCGALNRDCHGC